MLSRAGQVMDRNGLTKAGRALEKHSSRNGSVFPKVTGSAFNKNIQAQYHLDNILTHPGSKIRNWNHRDFGKIIDFEVARLGGARFYQNGGFIGLLEPQKWIH